MAIEPMEDDEPLTKDEIKKFKELTRKDYGVKLTNKPLNKERHYSHFLNT